MSTHSSNQVQVDTALAVDTPMHVRLQCLQALMKTLELALSQRREITDFDATALVRLAFLPGDADHPWAPHIDQFLHVKREIVSPRMLLFALHLRLDLNRHEKVWCKGENQVTMADIISADHREPWKAVWTEEPILFWTAKKLMAVVVATQHQWALLAPGGDYVQQLLKWLMARAALLSTFHFDGTTLDDDDYRCVVRDSSKARPTYRASTDFLWDFMAVVVPMYRNLHLDDGTTATEAVLAAPYDEDKLKRFVRRVVFHMHGDNLPQIYARSYIAKHTFPGEREWYIRRRSQMLDFNVENIRPIDVLRECRGDVYARKIHEFAGRPLNEVAAADPLEPSLVAATCFYYASQRKYAWQGKVVFLPLPVNRYAAWVDDDTLEMCPTYTQAVLHFCMHRWPAEVFDEECNG